MRIRVSLALFFALQLALPPAAAQVVSVPTGFHHETLSFALVTPSAMDFLPDGRILVAEVKTGQIRVVALAAPGGVQVGSLGSVPELNGIGSENGLLGVAVDPQWPVRPYVYAVWNHLSSGSVRLSMFDVAGDLSDPASVQLQLGTEVPILVDVPDLDELHNGGSIEFGSDGTLFVALGDDQDPCTAQDVDSLLGKVLRLDVSGLPSGVGPPAKSAIAAAGNPYATSDNAALVWCYGLRNPFRIDVHPVNDDVLVADVGASTWEEINHATAGGENFGWPVLEGPAALLACPPAAQGFTAPVVAAAHADGFRAIIGLDVVPSAAPGAPYAFGSAYEGDYLYSDFALGAIRRLVPDVTLGYAPAGPVQGQPNPLSFATGFQGVTDGEFGPDGALYLIRLTGALERIEGLHPLVQGTLAPGGAFTVEFAHPADAGRIYVCGFALSSVPGIPTPDGVVPLNFDALFQLSLQAGNGAITNNIGLLDSNGAATTNVVLPPNPNLSGLTFVAAYVVFDGVSIETISHPAPLPIQ